MRASTEIRMVLLGMMIPAAAWGQAAPAAAPVPKSLPFTMSQTETRVQALPDGATVTHVTVVRTLRDSQGRTRTERTNSNGVETVRREGNKSYLRHQPEMVVITVNDPVAGIMMTWTENAPGQSKLVAVNHISKSNMRPSGGVTQQPMATQLGGPEAVSSRDDLGIKLLKGVYVRGTRTTTEYPAEFDGNTAAYTTFSEYWRSEDLNGLIVEQTNSSLGTKSTTTLDSYTPGEPDASVFQAPKDYTVWDRQASGEAR